MKNKKILDANERMIRYVYDTVDVFCFPEDYPKVQAIYDKQNIEKCFCTKI